MTLAQRETWQLLGRVGFSLVLEAGEIVRVTRHGDNRVILPDGSQKRGHHETPKAAGQRGPFKSKGVRR